MVVTSSPSCTCYVSAVAAIKVALRCMPEQQKLCCMAVEDSASTGLWDTVDQTLNVVDWVLQEERQLLHKIRINPGTLLPNYQMLLTKP